MEYQSDHQRSVTATRAQLRELAKEMRRRHNQVEAVALSQKHELLRPLSTSVELKRDASVSYAEFSKQLDDEMGRNKPWWAINPEGQFRRIWDGSAAILIYAMMFYVPCLVAYFDEPCCAYLWPQRPMCHPNIGVSGDYQAYGWQILPIFTNAFFLVDIAINLVTGHIEGSQNVRFLRSHIGKQSVTNYELPLIWKNYAKGWLYIDVVACIPLECILTAAAPSVNWYNTGKFIRLLRAVGLQRRCRGSPFGWVDLISTRRKEFSYSAGRLVAASAYTFLTVHYFSCLIWWTIRLQDYPSITWPVEQGLVQAPFLEQYLWSLFCIVSGMIGLGYGAFPPRTWPEALVWVIAMIASASMFAIINGFIVSAILTSASARHRYKDRMDRVMAAVKQQQLPEDLRRQVMHYFQFKYRNDRIGDIDALWREVPYDMRAEIALASSRHLLLRLDTIFQDDGPLLEQAAMLLQSTCALAGEEIIKQGWPADRVYFVTSGFVDLVLDGQVVETLRTGDSFGDAALLPLPTDEELQEACGCNRMGISSYADRFTSVAAARALTNVDLVALDASEFEKLVGEFPATKRQLCTAAIRHAKRLKDSGLNLEQPLYTRASQLHSASVYARVHSFHAESNVNMPDLRNRRGPIPNFSLGTGAEGSVGRRRGDDMGSP